MKAWRFEQPPETPVLADRELVDGSGALCSVLHKDDGSWVFHALSDDWERASEDWLVSSTLGCIAENYPEIIEIAELSCGFLAYDRAEGREWTKRPIPSGPVHCLEFDVVPLEGNSEFGKIRGAIALFWIRAESAESALRYAQDVIDREKWAIRSLNDVCVVERSDYEPGDDGLEYFLSAEAYGLAICTMSYLDNDDEDEDEDDDIDLRSIIGQ